MAIRFTDWLNGNQFKEYPFAQNNDLAQQVLVDASIMMSDEYVLSGDTQGFYISQITSNGSTFDLYVGYFNGSTVFSRVAKILAIPVTSSSTTRQTTLIPCDSTGASFTGYTWLGSVTGQIALGNTQTLSTPRTYTFTTQTGKLNPVCVQQGIGCVTALVVGSTRLYGDVHLYAGSGIEFSVDQSANSVTISRSAATDTLQIRTPVAGTISDAKAVNTLVYKGQQVMKVDTTSITATTSGKIKSITSSGTVQQNAVVCTLIDVPVDLSQAKANLLSSIGSPILTINGKYPDSTGNILLTGIDCVQVQSYDGLITITNPCSKPCCGSDTDTEIKQALSVVQADSTTLMNHYVSLSNSINTMASRLATLIAK